MGMTAVTILVRGRVQTYWMECEPAKCKTRAYNFDPVAGPLWHAAEGEGRQGEVNKNLGEPYLTLEKQRMEGLLHPSPIIRPIDAVVGGLL
jgi:hypothetical protein